jgi:hypothetical protein
LAVEIYQLAFFNAIPQSCTYNLNSIDFKTAS